MPMSEPTTSTTTYFGETRSQPVSSGAAGATGAAGGSSPDGTAGAGVAGDAAAAAAAATSGAKTGAGAASAPCAVGVSGSASGPGTAPSPGSKRPASSRISGMRVLFLLGFGVVGREGAEGLGDEAGGEQQAGSDRGG